jgi:hypothetical protein
MQTGEHSDMGHTRYQQCSHWLVWIWTHERVHGTHDHVSQTESLSTAWQCEGQYDTRHTRHSKSKRHRLLEQTPHLQPSRSTQQQWQLDGPWRQRRGRVSWSMQPELWQLSRVRLQALREGPSCTCRDHGCRPWCPTCRTVHTTIFRHAKNGPGAPGADCGGLPWEVKDEGHARVPQ